MLSYLPSYWSTFARHWRFPLRKEVYAWTDSTIVINWLEVAVGNRVSFIMDRLPPNRWNHVSGEQNPADCTSRGLLPLELFDHELWWNGPLWLRLPSSNWPKKNHLPLKECSEEQREICFFTNVESSDPIIPVNRFSSFTKIFFGHNLLPG